MVGSSARIPTSAPGIPTLVKPVRIGFWPNKRGPTGGTALLTVIVGEGHTFIADPIDVRRAVPHLAAIVVADIPPADVISPKDEDVRLARLSRHLDLPCLIRRAGASDEAVSETRRLHLTQQHSKESE